MSNSYRITRTYDANDQTTDAIQKCRSQIEYVGFESKQTC